jgi:hypothetical protein
MTESTMDEETVDLNIGGPSATTALTRLETATCKPWGWCRLEQ